MGPSATTADQLDELARFAASAEARRAAAHEVSRLGLPNVDADDLVQHAYERLVVRIRCQPLDGDVVAYARRAMRNRALDLAGARTRLVPTPLDDLDPPAVHPPETPDDEALIDAVRASLLDGWAPRTSHTVSAALALLTLEVHQIDPHPDAPRPAAGPGDARRWAALWTAGLDDFPGPDGDPPDRRQRRRRALERAVAALGAAARRAQGLPPTGAGDR